MSDSTHTFAEDAQWFVKQACSRKRVLPTFAGAGGQLTKRAEKDLQKFLESHAIDKIYSEEGRLVQYTVPSDYASRHTFLRRAFDDFSIFSAALPRMTLVSIVSLYDAYISKLLRNIFKIKPEILNSCARQITFSELQSFGSIDAARDYIVEQEIESIMRESHATQVEWLESRLNVKLTGLPSWKNFIEITERRNLLVHADGVVSRQYMKVCERAGYKLEKDIAIGDKLYVSPEYYDDACAFITEVAIKLTQVVWRKLLPSELEDAEISFINVTYDLLLQKEYKLAELILNIAREPAFKKFNAESSYLLQVNYAISLRGQDKNEECKELIKNLDFSALADKFKLAQAVLLEDYDNASTLMKRIGINPEVGQLQYKYWPLFRWFRKTDQFKLAYEELFGEPFSITETAVSTEQSEELHVAGDDIPAEAAESPESTSPDPEDTVPWVLSEGGPGPSEELARSP